MAGKNMNTIEIHPMKCGEITPPGGKTYPAYCYLVIHPVHGKILIDTGLSSDSIKLWPKYLRMLMNPKMGSDSDAVFQLNQLGISPYDIDLLIITHLDADHISALNDFAGKARMIVMAEHEYFYSCRTVYRFRQPPELWLKYADYIDRRYFTSVKLGPEGRGFDVFNDRSVICIHTPGHTEGQIAVMVSNGRTLSSDGLNLEGKYILFGSDSVFRPMTFDAKGQEKAKEWMDRIRDDDDCSLILNSHDSLSEKHFQIR